MATVNSTRGVKLVLKKRVGTSSPKVFTALCTINAERGITFNAQTNDQPTIECTDPDAIAWAAREKTIKSVDFTGGGMHHKNDTKKLWNAWNNPEAEEYQVILDDDDPANVITFQGFFHLTTFDLTGNRGERVNSTMALASDGAVTAVFGSNVNAS